MLARASSQRSAPSSDCFPPPGLVTHRMTKNPIISMTRSAKVKIHSGHSSHSDFLHLQLGFAIRVHRGDAESAENHSGRLRTRRLMPSFKTGTLKLMSNPTCQPPSFM